MENRLPVFKGADISEDVSEDLADLKRILSDPVSGVGIGAHGDDFTAQFLEPVEVVCGRQEAAAAVKTAGVQRDSFRASMLKAWDLECVELDDKGAIKDVDGLNAAIKKDYSDFIATSEDKPLPKNDPPSGGGQTFTRADIEKMSVEEINKNWDAINKQLPSMK